MEVIKMTEARKQEIITALNTIVKTFVPSTDEPVLTYFGLISSYNKANLNPELVGGGWARDNGINLA